MNQTKIKARDLSQTQKVASQILSQMGCVRCGLVATSPRETSVTTGASTFK
jgi:hypothetical protein